MTHAFHVGGQYRFDGNRDFLDVFDARAAASVPSRKLPNASSSLVKIKLNRRAVVAGLLSWLMRKAVDEKWCVPSFNFCCQGDFISTTRSGSNLIHKQFESIIDFSYSIGVPLYTFTK